MVSRKVFSSIMLFLLITLISGCGLKPEDNLTLEAQEPPVQELPICETEVEVLYLDEDTEDVFEKVVEYANENNSQVKYWYPVEDNRFNDMYSVGSPSGWTFRGVPIQQSGENKVLPYEYLGEWILGDVVAELPIGGQSNYHHVGNILVISEDSVVYHRFHSDDKRVKITQTMYFSFKIYGNIGVQICRYLKA